MVTDTSKYAYEYIKEELGFRQLQVYNCLRELRTANNLMISKKLKMPINSITPRVKELRDMKLVGVAFTAPDLNTGRPSIYWKVVK